MPAVVTTNHNPTTGTATYVCAHAGTALPTAALARQQVDGFDTLVATDIIGTTISSCTWTGGGQTPCTLVGTYIAGASIIHKKGGVFIILSGATFVTNGNAPVLVLTCTDTQTKLTST